MRINKVLFVIASLDSGGSERYISSLANEFTQKGINCAILTNTNKPNFYKLDDRIKRYFLNINTPGKNIVGKLNNNIKRMRILKGICEEYKPDAILSISYMLSLMSAIIGKILKIPTLTSERANPYINRKNASKIMGLAMKLSNGIIFQTEGAKKFYSKSIQKKSKVIFNPIGNPYVQLNNLQLKEKNQVVSISRLHYIKGNDILIKSFKYVANKNDNIILKIYGEGKEEKNLKQLIKDLNLENRVYLMGAKKDAIRDAVGSKVYVLPSRSEGFPNSLIEAMASGIPSISFDCDFGPRDIIKNNANGILVPAESEQELANAIVKLLDNKELREKIGNEGRKIREQLAKEKITDEILNYMESLYNK